MASSAKIKMQMSFADDTTMDVEISPLDPTSTAITNAKTNIKAFDPASVQGVLISEGGATCTGIAAATVTKVTETDINLHVGE